MLFLKMILMILDSHLKNLRYFLMVLIQNYLLKMIMLFMILIMKMQII